MKRNMRFADVLKIAFAVSMLFVLSSCATTRTVPFEYAKVAALLKKRFVTDYDEFKQTKPEVVDRSDSMVLKFESPVDFYYGVRVTLGARKLDAAETELSAWIMEEHRTFFGSSGRSKSLEKSLLDIIGKRLETGRWERMPWRPEKK